MIYLECEEEKWSINVLLVLCSPDSVAVTATLAYNFWSTARVGIQSRSTWAAWHLRSCCIVSHSLCLRSKWFPSLLYLGPLKLPLDFQMQAHQLLQLEGDTNIQDVMILHGYVGRLQERSAPAWHFCLDNGFGEIFPYIYCYLSPVAIPIIPIYPIPMNWDFRVVYSTIETYLTKANNINIVIMHDNSKFGLCFRKETIFRKAIVRPFLFLGCRLLLLIIFFLWLIHP